MKRFVSAWLPRFAIERMMRDRPGAIPPDAALVLVESGSHGLTLSAVNTTAAREGLRAGLRLADARAVLPGLLTRVAEPELDRRCLEKLATAAGRYGPNRNTEGANGLWIDITGVAHLFGGEMGLADDLGQRFKKAGFTVLLGIADTPGAAFVLARHAAPSSPNGFAIAPMDGCRTALAGCPVEGLRLDDSTVILLKRLGLRRIGQLYGLPRTALARRFRDLKGKAARDTGRARQREDLAASVIMRLDQALGAASDLRVPLAEAPRRIVRQTYPEGLISHDGIVSAIIMLAKTLSADLGSRNEGARRVRLSLFRVDNSVAEIVIGTSQPSREAGHMIRLLGEKLSDFDAGFGVDMMALAALDTEPLASGQSHLEGRTAEAHAIETARLIDRLTNRLDAASVFRLQPLPSHIPERAQKRVPADTPIEAAGHGPQRANRPAFLLQRPEQIDVIADVPDGPPARFHWRRISRRVVRASGPERIAPEWWRTIGISPATLARSKARRVRDYYEIEDEFGGRYWVFRAGLYRSDGEEDGDREQPPTWFLHGMFG
jgi:protein ImuB